MSNALLCSPPLRILAHVIQSYRGCFTTCSIQNEIQVANRRWRDHVEVVQCDHSSSFGVRAVQSIAKGSTVLSGEFLDQPLTHRTSHTIQMGPIHHVLMDLPARFLNHSCDANLGARKRLNAYDFVARRDIELGEELTFDYETTEYELGVPFPCRCGSPLCRTDIKGFRYHAKTVRLQVDSEWIADHLLEIDQPSKSHM